MRLTTDESKVLTAILSETLDNRCDDEFTRKMLISIIDKLNTEIY